MTVEHCQTERLCLQMPNLFAPAYFHLFSTPEIIIYLDPSHSEDDQNLNQNRHSARKLQAH